MYYKLGNSKKIKSIGETNNITCPNCKNTTEMSVFSNQDFRLDASFPFGSINNVYFIVCPKCSSIFSVNSSQGKSFKKGEKLSIGDFDLKELEKYDK